MSAREDSLEGRDEVLLGLVFEKFLVELEDSNSWVFVCFFECAFVRPVQVSASVLAFHPISILLVGAGQVLLEL